MTENGIHDPWRTGLPTVPQENLKPTTGTKDSDNPLDGDLRQPRRCFLRAPGLGGIAIQHYGNNNDALDTLLKVVFETPDLKKHLETAGFLCLSAAQQEARPDAAPKGFVIKGAHGFICAPHATDTDHGLRFLLLAFRQISNQNPTVRQALQKAKVSFIIE